MPYITREDGEHFVIPSYRDVLAAKNKNALKNEILQLSQSYGEYITMQRKGTLRYEVAFSPDTGYLLGESIWHHFKRPNDMIYCEVVPNTTEAILVIVKSGSVYLDGRFPSETIPEELVIFLTQENNFEIYVYGDVPISREPVPGKFSFEAKSVKSFTVLDKPVFPTVALLRIYQLQLVDSVLKSQGIGVLPLKQITIGIVAIVLAWMLWSYLTAEKEEVVTEETPQINPYKVYVDTLSTPGPNQQVKDFSEQIKPLFGMPGWIVTQIAYSSGAVTASVLSSGSKVEVLMNWAKQNGAVIDIKQNGVRVSFKVPTKPRSAPTKIYTLRDVFATLIDRISDVYPGNHLQLAEPKSKGMYQEAIVTINLDKVAPGVLTLIGQQFEDLPLVLQSMALTVDNGSLSGTINLTALGN